MKDKIIFFNTGWMDFYKGLKNDKIQGGGRHVEQTGWGHELFNFQEYRGNYFGYVQPKIDRTHGNPSTIRIEKLGASPEEDKIENVTVVWTARDPNNHGNYIIGWYKKAFVYRYCQPASDKSNRWFKSEFVGYFTKAEIANCRLLSVDERIFKVPRQGKGWMGQSNVWFAEKQSKFVKKVEKYIETGIVPAASKINDHGMGRQMDVLKKAKVEKNAILAVTQYYKRLGFSVKSVEKDNLGWDLTATNSKTQLTLEVKGLSGKSIAAELTPNEYAHLKSNNEFARLCIVTNALDKPELNIFSYSLETNYWTSPEGLILQLNPIISARAILVK
ncbi:protein of unknown function [Chitinophaga jiangningensis]|uniref:Protein NO VEIN C-terminal domain-containing protein n=1 Tax=Chitinophaga jiangningensis TaxID=1419482 RepID=A0A1M7INX0_9BACT|nr:DUF3883 domain-containing protein [Chitinophaga jiangningensis]SHM42502.1 protein of unknown function [Chitinophaga jiangningensis]